MRRMRWLVCALVIAGSAQGAAAADFGLPILRGSTVPDGDRWTGVYFGAQAGYTTASTDFGAGASSLISFILRNSVIQDQVASFTTLSKVDTSGTSFGGFVGYNTRWDEIILGVEGNYNRLSLNAMSASDSLSRSILNNGAAPAGHDHIYNMTVSANASVKLTDLATFRARAGWDAGPFLPYAFAGVAVGRADVMRSATVTGTLTDNFTVTNTITDPLTGQLITVVTPQSVTTTLALPGTQTETANGVFAYGWTLGLGVDFALMQNVFLRAEYEYVQFAPIKDMNVHLSTVRTALAIKF
jgi:outer membrane immunogenic protein